MTPVRTAHRPPGVRVEARPSGPRLALPRMDVAGFVGYAARGPLHVPVPVEDVDRFTALFGPDPELAWDERRGQAVHAVLGAAVRSFFRNGGRRCYVVRVAGPGAATSEVQLPGLLAVTGGSTAPAVLRARSEGSWADRLRVAVETTATHVLVRTPSLRAGVLELLPGRSAPVAPGDLLRVPFLDRPDGWTLVGTVGSVVTSGPDRPGARPAGPAGQVTRLQLDHRRWTRAVHLPGGTRLVVGAWPGSAQTGPVPAEVVDGGGRLRLRVPVGEGPAPSPGCVLRLGEVPVDVVPDGDDLWALVEEPAAGPGAQREAALVTVQLVHVRRTVPAALAGVTGRRSGSRVELRLRTEDGEQATSLDLGWGPQSARYVGALPDDRALLGPGQMAATTGPDGVDRSGLHEDAGVPRFPLAGPAPSVPEQPPPAYLPLAEPGRSPTWVTATGGADSARRRDGLVTHDWSTFVDEELAEVGTGALLTAAAHLRFGGGGPAPEALHGLHALLAVDEVSMIAVPDAALRAWGPPSVLEPAAQQPEPGAAVERAAERFGDCTSTALTAPELAVAGGPAQTRLSWSGAPVGAHVEVEQATTPGFDPAVALYRGSRSSITHGRPDGPRWFRARWVLRGATGPWAVVGPLGEPVRPDAVLVDPADDGDEVALPVHRALVRLCAARGDALALLCLPSHVRGAEVLRHVARLRTHAGEPSHQVPGLGAGEDAALSHAVLHHPWLVVGAPGRPDVLRRVPPDGAAAGVLARRSADRGPWAAAANVPLLDVLALEPVLEAQTRSALAAAGATVVEPTARGFVTLSAETLADDVALRPVPVRRLLHLLRRLVVRVGEQYAFEPNGEVLRRAAQRGFEGVLTELFTAGALAGRRPEEAFQVGVTTAQGRDGERLVVELRVAPSLPLCFLTVRLVRSADGRLSVEAAA